MKHVLLTVLLIAVLACAGCSAPPAGTATPPDPVSQSPESEFALNESVHPGDDFYAYVNDAWMAGGHPIPADKQYYATFTEMRDRVDNDLHALFLNASAVPAGGDADRNITLIGRFYLSGGWITGRSIGKGSPGSPISF